MNDFFNSITYLTMKFKLNRWTLQILPRSDLIILRIQWTRRRNWKIDPSQRKDQTVRLPTVQSLVDHAGQHAVASSRSWDNLKLIQFETNVLNNWMIFATMFKRFLRTILDLKTSPQSTSFHQICILSWYIVEVIIKICISSGNAEEEDIWTIKRGVTRLL